VKDISPLQMSQCKITNFICNTEEFSKQWPEYITVPVYKTGDKIYKNKFYQYFVHMKFYLVVDSQ
jgi:hypothetical protein